jgi:RNA polymerase sigma-70 factor (ECF subfamily)
LGDDELAVLASTAGDASAFGELVRRHQGVVRGFLRRLTGDAAQADDLAQEAFIKAFTKISAYKGPGRFKSWVLSIAYREFLMHRRRADSLNRVLGLVGLAKAGEGPDGFTDDATPDHGNHVEASLDLEKGLVHLRGPEKEALLLCDAYGFSHAEAAKMMKAPLGTVKSHVLRGRKRLRAVLGSDALIASTGND